MGRQIVHRDLPCGGLNWQPALQNQKNIYMYIIAILLVDRLRIVLLEDTEQFFHLKVLSIFDKI